MLELVEVLGGFGLRGMNEFRPALIVAAEALQWLDLKLSQGGAVEYDLGAAETAVRMVKKLYEAGAIEERDMDYLKGYITPRVKGAIGWVA